MPFAVSWVTAGYRSFPLLAWSTLAWPYAAAGGPFWHGADLGHLPGLITREALTWWFVVRRRWICALIRPVPCGTIGPVIVEGDRLWDLLRSLDDPEHLDFPAGFNRDETGDRFGQLVDRLDTAFSCACEADGHVQDASYHGRIEIPAAATATGTRLVIVVSNFGGLAVVAADNPGVWTQEEFTELLHPDDAQRIYTALDDLGYTVVPEEPLWQTYDGNGPLPLSYHTHLPTWWIRFFDYL
jgi:hypothetical protein